MSADPAAAISELRGHLVDLHCHLLPGVDDGPDQLEGSLAMARQASTDGISVMCATPHIRSDHDVVIDELPERVAALNAAIATAGIRLLVVTGGELAAPLAAELTDAELRAVSLGGTGRWVLVEPADGPMGDALDGAVDALHERGVRCVIAHPERHAGADAADRLAGLVARGALVQVTADLLVDHPAGPTMLDWAAHGLVHLVGSDSHSAQIGRPAAVSAGLAALAAVPLMATHLRWVALDGPLAVLAGGDADPPFSAIGHEHG